MGIVFDFRTHLDETIRLGLIEDLHGLLGCYGSSEDDAGRVVVSRPSADPSDERIVAVIESRTGRRLGSITAQANGTGALLFEPSD